MRLDKTRQELAGGVKKKEKCDEILALKFIFKCLKPININIKNYNFKANITI